jgi:ABC-type molybdate transport system substrate-binding protein
MPSAKDVPAVEISLLFSSEKQDWLEAETASFQKEHPEIHVRLKSTGSIEGAQAIVDGKEKPTIFAPADTMIENLLVSEWQAKYKTDIVAPSGDDAPQPLVLTPLVFVAWEDRAAVLENAAGGAITWKTIRNAVVSNEGWLSIKGQASWGFVKLGHTDPTRSNSGLQALLMMTLEYYGKTRGLEVGDLLNSKYQDYIRDIEKGVPKFETSTGTFMLDVVRFGPSKYDIAVVYENLAVSQMENAQGRWGNLKVYYPGMTLWSDHPASLLQGDWVTDAQKKAARVLIAYLRAPPSQGQALNYGFRPSDPAVPVKTADANNPFVRLAKQGLKVDLPPAAQAPDGQVVRNMMMMWSRVVPAR